MLLNTPSFGGTCSLMSAPVRVDNNLFAPRPERRVAGQTRNGGGDKHVDIAYMLGYADKLSN
jgi:hypothetical protein